jgi:hypothetical protein
VRATTTVRSGGQPPLRRPTRRAIEALAAVTSLVTAAALTAQWTDRGDATCTALYRVDRANYWFTGDCTEVMAPRLGLVVLLIATATILAIDALRRRPSARRQSTEPMRTAQDS